MLIDKIKFLGICIVLSALIVTLGLVYSSSVNKDNNRYSNYYTGGTFMIMDTKEGKLYLNTEKQKVVIDIKNYTAKEYILKKVK